MAILETPNLSVGGQPRVLARIGTYDITEADVDRFIAALGQRGEMYRQNPQGRKAVLEQMIAQRLFLLDAQRNLMEREPAFKEQLAAVKEQLLMEYAIEKTLKDVKVNEEEIRRYYDEHPEQFAGEETVAASHILVASEEEASTLLEKIRAGEVSFEDAAREHSTCPSSAQGGSLGEFGRGQMVPEFDAACFDMEIGELRGPIQTQFGYHLIRLDKKNDAKPLEYKDIHDPLQAHLMQEKQQNAYQSKINQLQILYPVDRF